MSKTVPIGLLTNREAVDAVASHYGKYLGGAGYARMEGTASEAGQVLYDLCLESGIVNLSEIKNTARVLDRLHKLLVYDGLVTAKPVVGSGATWLVCSDWLCNPSSTRLQVVENQFNQNMKRGISYDKFGFGNNIESCLAQSCIRYGKGVGKNCVVFNAASAISYWAGCHEVGFYDTLEASKPYRYQYQAQLRGKLYRTFERQGMLPVIQGPELRP